MPDDEGPSERAGAHPGSASPNLSLCGPGRSSPPSINTILEYLRRATTESPGNLAKFNHVQTPLPRSTFDTKL